MTNYERWKCILIFVAIIVAMGTFNKALYIWQRKSVPSIGSIQGIHLEGDKSYTLRIVPEPNGIDVNEPIKQKGKL